MEATQSLIINHREKDYKIEFDPECDNLKDVFSRWYKTNEAEIKDGLELLDFHVANEIYGCDVTAETVYMNEIDHQGLITVHIDPQGTKGLNRRVDPEAEVLVELMGPRSATRCECRADDTVYELRRKIAEEFMISRVDSVEQVTLKYQAKVPDDNLKMYDFRRYKKGTCKMYAQFRMSWVAREKS